MRSSAFSDFIPEWAALVSLALIDVALARALHFHLLFTTHDGLLIGLGLGAACVLRLLASHEVIGARWGMMAEYFALTAAATLVAAVLSYLCLAASGVPIDNILEDIDRHLGFDWMAGYRFLVAHPLAAAALQLAYNSLVYQGLYFCVLFSLMDDKQSLREMFWLVFVAALLTSAGAMLWPAFGPYKLFGVAPAQSFLPEMEHLKSGRDLSFVVSKMTGVVSFPSFHTSMALIYAWGFRRAALIGRMVFLLNLTMLIAIPWYGGHYAVDMVAGAAVMLISLAIVRSVAALSGAAHAAAWQPFPNSVS